MTAIPNTNTNTNTNRPDDVPGFLKKVFLIKRRYFFGTPVQHTIHSTGKSNPRLRKLIRQHIRTLLALRPLRIVERICAVYQYNCTKNGKGFKIATKEVDAI